MQPEKLTSRCEIFWLRHFAQDSPCRLPGLMPLLAPVQLYLYSCTCTAVYVPVQRYSYRTSSLRRAVCGAAVLLYGTGFSISAL